MEAFELRVAEEAGKPSTMRYWPVYFADGPRQTCFTIHSDGKVTVDDWCRYQAFSKDFLCQSPDRYLNTPSPSFVRYDPAEGLVHFEVDNGKATYKIVGEDPFGLVRGELVEAELDMPGRE